MTTSAIHLPQSSHLATSRANATLNPSATRRVASVQDLYFSWPQVLLTSWNVKRRFAQQATSSLPHPRTAGRKPLCTQHAPLHIVACSLYPPTIRMSPFRWGYRVVRPVSADHVKTRRAWRLAALLGPYSPHPIHLSSTFHDFQKSWGRYFITASLLGYCDTFFFCQLVFPRFIWAVALLITCLVGFHLSIFYGIGFVSTISPRHPTWTDNYLCQSGDVCRDMSLVYVLQMMSTKVWVANENTT